MLEPEQPELSVGDTEFVSEGSTGRLTFTNELAARRENNLLRREAMAVAIESASVTPHLGLMCGVLLVTVEDGVGVSTSK